MSDNAAESGEGYLIMMDGDVGIWKSRYVVVTPGADGYPALLSVFNDQEEWNDGRGSLATLDLDGAEINTAQPGEYARVEYGSSLFSVTTSEKDVTLVFDAIEVHNRTGWIQMFLGNGVGTGPSFLHKLPRTWLEDWGTKSNSNLTSWKERYLALYTDRITWSSGDVEGTELGELLFTSDTEVRLTDERENAVMVHVGVQDNGRRFVMSFKDEFTRRKWLGAVQRAVGIVQGAKVTEGETAFDKKSLPGAKDITREASKYQLEQMLSHGRVASKSTFSVPSMESRLIKPQTTVSQFPFYSKPDWESGEGHRSETVKLQNEEYQEGQGGAVGPVPTVQTAADVPVELLNQYGLADDIADLANEVENRQKEIRTRQDAVRQQYSEEGGAFVTSEKGAQVKVQRTMKNRVAPPPLPGGFIPGTRIRPAKRNTKIAPPGEDGPGKSSAPPAAAPKKDEGKDEGVGYISFHPDGVVAPKEESWSTNQLLIGVVGLAFAYKFTGIFWNYYY